MKKKKSEINQEKVTYATTLFQELHIYLKEGRKKKMKKSLQTLADVAEKYTTGDNAIQYSACMRLYVLFKVHQIGIIKSYNYSKIYYDKQHLLFSPTNFLHKFLLLLKNTL